jgi:hypothetical protein
LPGIAVSQLPAIHVGWDLQVDCLRITLSTPIDGSQSSLKALKNTSGAPSALPPAPLSFKSLQRGLLAQTSADQKPVDRGAAALGRGPGQTLATRFEEDLKGAGEDAGTNTLRVGQNADGFVYLGWVRRPRLRFASSTTASSVRRRKMSSDRGWSDRGQLSATRSSCWCH